MGGKLCALTLAGIVAGGSAPQAQVLSVPPRVSCHDYKEIARQLDSRYEEAPISLGMQSNGNILQVFASKDKDSWTILSISPQGEGCILAAGRRWEDLKLNKEGPEA
ncbi:MAG: hypothetical protein H6851_15290 [Geminicoccaceae bacterium]|nr:hypothetical protein [Geminicoccaceae bacterium]MCB9944970.1 hypothetical protein [Geminicoccaceae bacterium]